ncbi:MAG TPA: Holliday junction branch migration protein RuvA [Gammaproteobacteria bacterium]|nr:Holliday junction branch migration protein RuvA [Gammaproteobacteria bacterium]
MIGHIRGKLIAKNPPTLLVDVNGVGYELEAPMSTIFDLPETGREVTLVTHFYVREDAQILFGFLTQAERGLFRLLLKVNGVGAKMALAILSSMNPAEFRGCILGGDQAALIKIPGIGKKTAERLIVEMRDRLEKESGLAAPTAPGAKPVAADPVAEATEALMALGYKPAEASRMVRAVPAQGLGSEEIIRRALKGAL